MNIRNRGWAQQLQTSSVELSRLQAGVSHLRTSVERSQSTKNRDADNLRNLRQEYTSLARENLRQSAEIERFILSLQEAEIETARIQSPWEDAQNTLNNWSHAAEEMRRTSVGSGDTTPVIAT